MTLMILEGIDGSGKSTQAEKLAASLTSRGLDVATMRFPRYDETEGGQMVGDFLDGKFGTILADLHPKLVSLPYMIDRFESVGLLKAHLQSRQVVIVDRYVASNVAHQAAKLPEDEWDEFFDWVRRLEMGVFGLPMPDITIQPLIDVEHARKLILKKQKRSYTDADLDLHEADMEYQTKVDKAYQRASHTGYFSETWYAPVCVRNGHLRPVEDIAHTIFSRVYDLLEDKGVLKNG